MPPSTRNRSELARIFSILSVCLCLVFAIATSGETQTASRPIVVAQNHSEARQAMDRGDMLHANWTKASLQEAIVQYEKAAHIWTSAADFASASQATLKSGDVYFRFSEYGEALKRYQTAEVLAGKAGDWLAKASALSHKGRAQSFIGNNKLAQQELTRALDLFKEQEGNRSAAANNAYSEALSNLAEVSYAMGDFVNARQHFKSALEVLENDRKVEAKIHLFNSYITGSTGNPEKAVQEVSRALDLYRSVNDRIGEGLALTTLGLSHSLNRDVNRATEFHNKAIDIFRVVGDRHSEAIALNALGQAYQGVNNYKLAINHYEQALRLFEEIGSADGVSVTTFKLARTYDLSGDPEKALAFYERCLQWSRAAGKVRTEANALIEIAKIYVSNGRHELALQQYQKIQRFYESIGDPRGQATAMNAYGDLLLQLGQKEKALEASRRALPLSEKAGDKGLLISTLYNLARANLALGSPELALPLIRRSLEIIEDLRANVASPDFRVSYFSGVQTHYELCVDILMQLERRRPGEGFATEALLVSEKGRARLLFDLVKESRANLRDGAAKELLDRERELKKLFRKQAEYEMDLSLKRDSTEILEVKNQMAQLEAEYQDVQAKLREQNPRLFSIEQSVPLTLQQIQNELRESDTMLLEYDLGDDRSYLWAVTSNSLQSYELPGRKTIEDAAVELFKLTTARQQVDGEITDYKANVQSADDLLPAKAANLSKMLLGPVVQLQNRRLLIVTEGALQYVSFEALPVPVPQTTDRIEENPSKTLLETNEIVALPSASTLIAIRGPRKHASSPGKLVAVIADPVFGRNDERVQSEALSSVALAAPDKNPDASLSQFPETSTGDADLPRLAHSSEEADAISAVAPWGTTMVAKGFDANRETVMSADVAQYQILHFATHGFLHSSRPELSSIVLTKMDRNGEKINGLMPLYDIYGLSLSADLVVLSACQTALGKEIKGEGQVGLAHSFMSAGAKSVVASLWKVDDRATAVLMDDFYEGMLQKGMTPSAALRAAKLKMMRDKRWSAPYYWAGFVLQGEYSNHIVVDRHARLRPGLVFLFLLILIAAPLAIFLKRKRRIPPGQFT